MKSSLAVLILACFVASSVSAPVAVTTPPPTSASADDKLEKSDMEDVMMDPSAKLRKLQNLLQCIHLLLHVSGMGKL